MSVQCQVKFILLLMPGFSLLSLGGFLDKLRFSGDDEDYSRQVICHWTLASLTTGPVKASCGAQLLPDSCLSSLQLSTGSCDYFVIFGGNIPSVVLAEAALYQPWLRSIRNKSIPLVSIDNAAFLLAACGLAGQQILVHWRHYNEFAEAFPLITPVTDQNVLQQQQVYSCPGGHATIELATLLLEKKLGSSRAYKGLSDMLVAGFSAPAAAGWHFADLQNSTAPVRAAIITMRKNISNNLSAEEIARSSGLSRRQLDRCLISETGFTSRQLYSEMKLDYASWLMLRTSRSMQQIAAECGFTDASHFSRHFKRRSGSSPARWRLENKPPVNS